jgi:hypothetical protein
LKIVTYNIHHLETLRHSRVLRQFPHHKLYLQR